MTKSIDNMIDTVQCGDCLEVMRDMPDNCVDLVLTDPPWPNCDVWPEINPYELFALAAPEISRISKRIIIILGVCSDPAFLKDITLPFVRYCWLRYARPNYCGKLLLGNEVAFVYGELPSRRPDRKIFGGECVKTNKEKLSIYNHPCCRSYQHIEWLVKHYSNPGEIILDPFCGSGTTCEAALREKRHSIGIDINETYCDTARQRIKAVDTGVPVKEVQKGQMALWAR